MLVAENLSIEQASGSQEDSQTEALYGEYLLGVYQDQDDFEATGIEELPDLNDIPEGYCSDELYEA